MYKSVSTRFSLITAAMLGVIMGVLALMIINMEMKWLLYALFGFVFLTAVLVIKNRERFFWGLFIMSLQIFVSFRLFYGHAGSGGFVFPLAFISGVMLLGYYFMSGVFPKKKVFLLGGDLSVPILLVFAGTIISLLFTTERFVGLVSLWSLMQYYLFYLIGMNCVQSKKHLDSILSLLIVVLVMQSMVYFSQALFGVTFTLTGEVTENFVGVRAGGTVGANSAIFAAFIAPLVMLVIVRLMSIDAKMKKRILWFFIAFIAAGAVILTLRRGAWGGYALGIICLLTLGYRRRLLSKGWLTASAISLVLLLVLAPIIVNVVDTYRTGNPLASAFDERMRLNKIAWSVIKANPLLGTGPGSYSHVYKEYISAEFGQGWNFTVHNTYLLTAAENGITGLLAFFLFLYSAFKLSMKLIKFPDKDLQYFGLAMASYIVTYAFIIYWEPMVAFSPIAMLWFLIGLMASAVKIQSGYPERYRRVHPESTVRNVASYTG